MWNFTKFGKNSHFSTSVVWKNWNSSSCGEIPCIEIWNFSTWQISSPPTCRWSRWQISGMQEHCFPPHLHRLCSGLKLWWKQHCSNSCLLVSWEAINYYILPPTTTVQHGPLLSLKSEGRSRLGLRGWRGSCHKRTEQRHPHRPHQSTKVLLL